AIADVMTLHSFPTRRTSDLRPALETYLPPLIVTPLIARFPPPPAWLKMRRFWLPVPSISSRPAPGPVSSTSCSVIAPDVTEIVRSEEHTSELQSREKHVCRH